MLLGAALLALGVGGMARSLSRRLAREDRLEQRDERNRLVQLRTGRAALRIAQGVSFALLAGALAAGKLTGYEGFFGIAVGLGLSVSVSLFGEMFAFLYYEHKT